MRDVLNRFHELAAKRPLLRLYALIDGFQYEQHAGKRIAPLPGVNRALFVGTEDEPLAHAGPWLVDLAASPESFRERG